MLYRRYEKGKKRNKFLNDFKQFSKKFFAFPFLIFIPFIHIERYFSLCSRFISLLYSSKLVYRYEYSCIYIVYIHFFYIPFVILFRIFFRAKPRTPTTHSCMFSFSFSLSFGYIISSILKNSMLPPSSVFVRSRSGGTRTSMFDFFPPKWSGALTSNFCAFLPFLRQGAFARRSTIVYTRLVIPLYHSFSIFRLSFPLLSFSRSTHGISYPLLFRFETEPHDIKISLHLP